jgi:hypothetical protein
MFAKLFSSITESSLWCEPKEVRLLFVTMLAKADQTGFVEASVPGLARIANLTLDETTSAIEVLSSPDKYSKNPEHEGRRIMAVPGGFMLLNYEDYRARRNKEQRNEYMRQYMKKKRTENDVNTTASNVNKTANNVSTETEMLTDVSRRYPPLAQAEAEAEAEAEYKSCSSEQVLEKPKRKKQTIEMHLPELYRVGFRKFYDTYPRKKAPVDAMKAYRKAIDAIMVDGEHNDGNGCGLMDAQQLLQEWLEQRLGELRSKGQYAPYPATWLNAGDYRSDIGDCDQKTQHSYRLRKDVAL